MYLYSIHKMSSLVLNKLKQRPVPSDKSKNIGIGVRVHAKGENVYPKKTQIQKPTEVIDMEALSVSEESKGQEAQSKGQAEQSKGQAEQVGITQKTKIFT